MDRSSIEFASLLASRLCHDLLSPVGAMNNGLELLADETDPAMREQCMDLLADSARTTAAKLKFFRLAFGAAGGFEDEIDTREAKAVIDGLIGGHSRTELDWMVSQPTMTKGRLKVLLNLSMIALEALVRGGRLSIGGEGDEIVRRAGVGGENFERVAHRDPIDCPLRLHDRQGAAQVSGIQKFVGHGSVTGLERQTVCGSAALAATVVQIRQLSQSVQPVRC